jgi:putative aminopeptidase FrvX
VIELLKELILEHGVSGYEAGIRNLIESKLPPDITRTTDNLGNFIVQIGQGEDEILFTAHMDELGFIVSEVRPDGFLRIRSLGGIDPRLVPGRTMRIKTKKGEVCGVVGAIPPHIMSEDRHEMKQVPQFEDMFVDVGASNAREAHSLGIEILDPVTFQKTFEILNTKYVSARGLDDRAGCAVLLQVIEKCYTRKMKGKVSFAFTVQEERGLRGAQLVGSYLKAKRAFAIDTAASALMPGSSPDRGPAVLGAGPALRCADSRYIADPEFVKEIRKIAARRRIPTQIIFAGGSTDVAAIEVQGPKSLPITIPLRYTHSPVEVANLQDLENTVKLVIAIVEHYTR